MSEKEHLQNYHALHNLFMTYVQQSCFFISVQKNVSWLTLIRSWKDPQPYYFAHVYGRRAHREKYLNEKFQEASRRHKTFWDAFWGFLDFFAPVRLGKKYTGVLYCGPFLEEVPDAGALCRSWEEMTGTKASNENPDFLRFVRSALETTVLSGALQEDFARLMDLWVNWLATGKGGEKLLQEVDTLRKRSFSKALPHPYWVDWVLGIDKFYTRTESERTLAGWEKEELGITVFPKAAGLLMIRETSKMEIVTALCSARKLQWAAYRMAHQFPETVCGPWGDYGVIVLFGTKSAAQNLAVERNEIHARMERFRQTLEKETGFSITAGIGGLSTHLNRSFQEAQAALRRALTEHQAFYFWKSEDLSQETSPLAMLRRALEELVEAVFDASTNRIVLAREAMVRSLLTLGKNRFDVLRAHVHSAFLVILERLKNRPHGIPEVQANLETTLWERIETAQNEFDLWTALSQNLAEIQKFLKAPKKIVSHVRVETVVQEMRQKPQESWPLEVQCRRTGLSAPTFLKRFREVTGEHYRTFLRRLRVERSRWFLAEGDMPLEQVAQTCGFSSASSYIQAFRQVYGCSPRAFMRNSPQVSPVKEVKDV